MSRTIDHFLQLAPAIAILVVLSSCAQLEQNRAISQECASQYLTGPNDRGSTPFSNLAGAFDSTVQEHRDAYERCRSEKGIKRLL
jgi:hypothetical protein